MANFVDRDLRNLRRSANAKLAKKRFHTSVQYFCQCASEQARCTKFEMNELPGVQVCIY